MTLALILNYKAILHNDVL